MYWHNEKEKLPNETTKINTVGKNNTIAPIIAGSWQELAELVVQGPLVALRADLAVGQPEVAGVA